MPKQREDIIMKYVMELFQGDAVQFFGIDEEVVSAERTELTHIDVQRNIDDWVFLTKNDTYLHFEFQTTYKKNDLSRFMVSDAMLYNKTGKPIKTVIVYSSEIKQAQSLLDAGSIQYKADAFYMAAMDGDSNYNRLSAKVSKGEELTKQDLITIVFLPLMRNSVTREARIMQAIDLSAKVNVEEQQLQIQGMLFQMADKFISDPLLIRKIKELISMNKIGELIARDRDKEIIKNGLEEGFSKDAIARILKINESELDNLLKEIEQEKADK